MFISDYALDFAACFGSQHSLHAQHLLFYAQRWQQLLKHVIKSSTESNVNTHEDELGCRNPNNYWDENIFLNDVKRGFLSTCYYLFSS